VIVDIQRGQQQRVQVGQPGPQVGVGRGGVRGARLHVQPLPFALPFHIGGGPLGRGDRQVGVAPDEFPLPGGRGAGPLLRGGLRGVRPLHVADDAHASSSLASSNRHHIYRLANPLLRACLRARSVHGDRSGWVGVALGSRLATVSDCPSWSPGR
jgi:hypothetical protein